MILLRKTRFCTLVRSFGTEDGFRHFRLRLYASAYKNQNPQLCQPNVYIPSKSAYKRTKSTYFYLYSHFFFFFFLKIIINTYTYNTSQFSTCTINFKILYLITSFILRTKRTTGTNFVAALPLPIHRPDNVRNQAKYFASLFDIAVKFCYNIGYSGISTRRGRPA